MAEHEDSELRTGAKAAAAAAAVGAAVGVARALASRADDAAHREEDQDDDRPDEREPEPEPEPEPEGEHEPAVQNGRPPIEREPRHGAPASRLRDLIARARATLEELSGVDVESVSAAERLGDGWRITLEVVELRRIPDTTDLLGTYEVELDDDGDVLRYERRRRYSRSQSDDGDRS